MAQSAASQQAEAQKAMAESFLSAIKNGEVEKVDKPWADGFSMAMNVVTGNYYSGMNTLTLSSTGESLFAGLKQWNKIGVRVKLEEMTKPHTIFLLQIIKSKTELDPNGKPRTFPYWKSVRVYGANQVEGWDREEFEKTRKVEPNDMDKVLVSHNVDVAFHSSTAGYSRKSDTVYMPKAEQFESQGAYYAVLAHELTHWTGHKSRNDREMGHANDTTEYAFEELVAELGAAFLCSHYNVAAERRKDHINYIAGWYSAINNDYKYFAKAVTLASKAFTLLIK